MTEPSKVVLVPIELVSFLLGEGEYDGLRFGEGKPGPGGRPQTYWWRHPLRRSLAAYQSSLQPSASVPAPADGQVASQRAWLVEEFNHDGVLRSVYATVSPDRPYSGPRGVDTIEVTPLYTSPTDQSSDVSGLVEEAEVSDLSTRTAINLVRVLRQGGLVAEVVQGLLDRIGEAKRDGGS